MKKAIILSGMILMLTACSKTEYESYTAHFYDVFDTVTAITGYEKSREDFDERVAEIYGQMTRLHKLYDIYNGYEGINNAKTINDNAGISPVKVDAELMELIEFGLSAYEQTDGAVNIAFGAVTEIWRESRLRALERPETAAPPSPDELAKASSHTDIEDIVIDKQAGTIFLKDPEMSLDLGALAKGYAVWLAGDAARESGFVSFLIDAGGNIYAAGKPMDGRDKWNVGILDPSDSSGGLFDTLSLNDGAVVSSGGYQRFFVAGGKSYHHIIDPKTLMPAERFAGVTVMHESAAVADMLSTAAFILPQEQGKALVERFGGQAVWIYADKSFEATEEYYYSPD